MSTDQDIENLIQDKGLTASRVTPEDVEAAIASEHYCRVSDGVIGLSILQSGNHDFVPANVPTALGLITICVLILKNGHRIVGVNEGPVSIDNFDHDLGRKLARRKAVDQIWPLLGYQLRSRLASEATFGVVYATTDQKS